MKNVSVVFVANDDEVVDVDGVDRDSDGNACKIDDFLLNLAKHKILKRGKCNNVLQSERKTLI